ncbi:MAG: DUF368 domain-containing protein [Pirellulales bacterium]
MNRPVTSLQQDAVNVARGFLMGGADIIPGVSGGTVALILGIYQRLVTSISHVDGTLIRHLRAGQFSTAAAHIDLRFLVALGSGIALGIGGLASLMHYLLAHHLSLTYATMFGLIAASCVLVARMVDRWSGGNAGIATATAVAAFWIVGLLPSTPPAGHMYLFLCGFVAICAMILPGISGAFILVIMGMYFHITGILKELLQGVVTTEHVASVAIFGAGCTVGLLGFSKLLQWLLCAYESTTMAALCGFMAGSLRKIWPFKRNVTLESLDRLPLPPEQLASIRSQPQPLEHVPPEYHIYENVWPDHFSGDVGSAIALAVLGAAAVLMLDYLTRASRRVPHLDVRDDLCEEIGASPPGRP